eukprot:gene10910-12907_t
MIFAGDKDQDRCILCGDVGGTNTRLRLLRLTPQEISGAEVAGIPPPGTTIIERKYLNQDFEAFEDVCHFFLKEAVYADSNHDTPRTWPVSAACFAVAGPVDTSLNRVAFTNRDWVIDGSLLRERLEIEGEVRLINDFVANGYGILTLDVSKGSSEVYALHDVPPRPGAPVACVGAGTGFGMTYATCPAAALAAPKPLYDAFASEGGHTEFAPRTKLEIELLEHLKQEYLQRGLLINHRISAERIVSGKGIRAVYEFLKTKWPEEKRDDVEEEMEKLGDNASAAIAQHGNPDARDTPASCWLCQTTMEIFWSTYGSECGSAALKWLPYGGLFIAGGIAQKNLGAVQYERASTKTPGHKWGFLPAYFDKGRLTSEVKKVPLYVVLVDDLGQRGAQLVAIRSLRHIHLQLEACDVNPCSVA